MRNVALLFLLFLTSSNYTIAQVSDLQAYQDSIRRALQEFRTSNGKEATVSASLSEYEAYNNQILADFEAFKAKMEQKWGSFKKRSNTQWVEYIDEGNTRVEVDFEVDKVTIDFLYEDPDDAKNTVQELPYKILDVINNQGTELGFKTDNKPMLNEPVLNGQLDKKPRESNQEYALRVLQENDIEVKPVVGKDSLERVMVSINFSLAPKAIQTRVKKVQDFVYRFSSAYNIPPPLVFAIIHTESFFNPMAQSPANAYGLMQLVPTSGGADAYRSVHNSDGYPTPEFLFIPENNVELGCAYIDILLNRYLNEISNVLTRQYLAIAAYNTGVSNVYKAYAPNGSKSRAIAQIQSMTPQDNYEYLIQNLPYEETIDYLKKVVDRSILYESWSEN